MSPSLTRLAAFHFGSTPAQNTALGLSVSNMPSGDISARTQVLTSLTLVAEPKCDFWPSSMFEGATSAAVSSLGSSTVSWSFGTPLDGMERSRCSKVLRTLSFQTLRLKCRDPTANVFFNCPPTSATNLAAIIRSLRPQQGHEFCFGEFCLFVLVSRLSSRSSLIYDICVVFCLFNDKGAEGRSTALVLANGFVANKKLRLWRPERRL